MYFGSLKVFFRFWAAEQYFLDLDFDRAFFSLLSCFSFSMGSIGMGSDIDLLEKYLRMISFFGGREAKS